MCIRDRISTHVQVEVGATRERPDAHPAAEVQLLTALKRRDDAAIESSSEETFVQEEGNFEIQDEVVERQVLEEAQIEGSLSSGGGDDGGEGEGEVSRLHCTYTFSISTAWPGIYHMYAASGVCELPQCWSGEPSGRLGVALESSCFSLTPD